MLQNYNKILTKRTVFSIILEENPDQDLKKKIRIFYAPRFFSGQNRKKKCANYASKYGILSLIHSWQHVSVLVNHLQASY